MKTITPNDLKNIPNTNKEHKHNWVFYNGCLGYESLVCSVCGIDINDLNEDEKKPISTLQTHN